MLVQGLVFYTHSVLRGAALTGFALPAPRFAVALEERGGGRRFWVGVLVEGSPPHRIAMPRLGEIVEGVAPRAAAPADGPALARLERRVPVRMGEALLDYDRGEDDYCAGERLMGDPLVVVLEEEGAPRAMFASVLHDVRIDGRVRRLRYEHRNRIDPDHQRRGLLGAAVHTSLVRERGDFVGSYGFVAGENERMLSLIPDVLKWSVRPERLVIDAAAQAAAASGAAAGRAATASDGGARGGALRRDARARGALRAVHGGVARAAARARAGGLRLAGRAARRARGGRHVAGEQETRDVRALVLDYGCEPGAEAELVSLLRATCAALAASGTTELSLFTSPPSPDRDALAALAKRLEPYVVQTGISPAALSASGVYVDQLYF